MKIRFFPLFALSANLLLASCNNNKTDGTTGEAVSDMNEATNEGGVKADAVVIDNEAGPTVTANADSVMAADSSMSK